MFPSRLLPCLVPLLVLLGAGPLAAQDELRTVEIEGRSAVAGEYVVHFAERNFDLSPLRAAVRARLAPDRYERLVAEIREKNEALRAPFAAAIRQLGGEVIEHYWIINASAIRIDAARVGAVEALEGVERVQPNWVFAPALGTATNAANHDSDSANQLLVGGKRLEGAGVTVAILDTGIDVNNANQGRPHLLYYEGGSLSGRNRILAALDAVSSRSGDDINGHGTMVSHCAGGAAWASSSYIDDGVAPNCDFVGINIAATSSGSTASTYLTRGWQMVLQYVRTYNIGVANNSYSGSPDPRDATQQALDAAAFNGDVLITVPSGNSGTNISAAQAGFNALNVGSANKNSINYSSFSGRGTTTLGKEIPDLLGIGASLYMAVLDRESSYTRANGTSFSAPIVAGAAALARQADPKLTALMVKALLLDTTAANSSGYGKGAGFLRADRLAQAALNQDVFEDRLDASRQKKSFPFVVTAAGTHSVTVTWHRQRFTTSGNEDLNLYVYDSSSKLVGSGTRSYANSFEKVAWTASPGVYSVEVVSGTALTGSVTFALAGIGQPAPPAPPTLTGISQTKHPVHGGSDLTLTGTNLDSVTTVLVGAQQVPPVSVSPTQLTFTPPVPLALGTVQVKVQNGGGTSNAVNFDYVPVAQPTLVAATALFSLVPNLDELWMQPTEIGVYYLSSSNQPSKAPGILDLGIGNGFTDLFYWGAFVPDAIGHSQLVWAVPLGFGSVTFHQQAVVIDTQGFVFPLQASNAVTRTVLF